MKKTVYGNAANNLLKAELLKRNLTYENLAELLIKNGTKTSTNAIRVKLSRGVFSARFFLECLIVLGVKSLSLSPDFFQTFTDEKNA